MEARIMQALPITFPLLYYLCLNVEALHSIKFIIAKSLLVKCAPIYADDLHT